MAIAIVDATPTSANDDTDAGSYSISPFTSITGLAAGQVAILAIACATPTTGAVTLSGWTQVNESQKSGAHVDSVWYRVVDAGDNTATTFTFDPPGTATGITYGCVVYSGVNTTTPFEVDSGSALSTADADDAIATPSVHLSVATSWYIVVFIATGGTDDTMNMGVIGGTTERVDIDGAETTGARCLVMSDSNGPTAVTDYTFTGTFTITASAADLSAWIGVLQTDAVAGTTLLQINQQALTRAANW